jgi:hypothetical protein
LSGARCWSWASALKPATDEQRHPAGHGPRTLDLDRADALSDVEAAQGAPFRRVLISVVAWATLLFTCSGASTNANALAITYEALGAAAVASAIYLILEFSQPYVGLFRISPERLD